MFIVVLKHNPAYDLKISIIFNPNICFTLCEIVSILFVDEVLLFTRVSDDYTTANWKAVCSFVDAFDGLGFQRDSREI